MRETLLQAKIMAVLNHRDSPCRLWRNNVGVTPGTYIRYGLGVGSADLVGLVVATGQFLAAEIKTPKGRMSDEQKAWHKTVRLLGGQTHVLRSVEEAEALVTTLRRINPMCVSHVDCIEDRDQGTKCANARRLAA